MKSSGAGLARFSILININILDHSDVFSIKLR